MFLAATPIAFRTSRSTRAAPFSISRRPTSNGPCRPSNRRAYLRSAVAPPRRTRSTMAATRRWSAGSLAGLASIKAATARTFDEGMMTICGLIRSEDDLVQRILDDAFGARRLEARNQIAHRAFLDDRVERHPRSVAER